MATSTPPTATASTSDFNLAPEEQLQPLPVAHTLGSWQSKTHRTLRRLMLWQIWLNLELKYGRGREEKMSALAQRMECALYHRAASMDEYLNTETLSKRLHAWMVKIHIQQWMATAKPTLPADVHNEVRGVKRTFSYLLNDENSDWNPSAHKIPRTNEVEKETEATMREQSPANQACFLFQQTHIQQYLFEFATTQDLLQLGATCKEAARATPAYIQSFRFSWQQLAPLSKPEITRFFHKYPKIKSLAIYDDAQRDPVKHPRRPTKKRSVKRPRQIHPQSNEVMHTFISSLDSVSLKQLKSLEFDHVYCDGLHDDLTIQLIDLLFDPDNERFPNLAHLSLRHNGIADDGVAYLTKTLQTFRARRGPLLSLDLRGNFVGQRGALAILAMVQQTPPSAGCALHSVHLGENLLGEMASLLPYASSDTPGFYLLDR